MRLIFRAVLAASILSTGFAMPVYPVQKGVGQAKSKSPSYTIGIFPFQDMSGGEYGESLARVLAKQLQAALLNASRHTPRFLKSSEGQEDVEQMDLESAINLARSQKVGFAVLGSLLSIEVKESGGGIRAPQISGVTAGGQQRPQAAEVVLQVELIDVERGERAASLRATGKERDTKISASMSTDYGSMDMGGAAFQNTVLGKAMQKAINEVVKDMLPKLETSQPASEEAARPAGKGAASQATGASTQAAAGARGQEMLQLKESGIRKLIPLLRAEASHLGAAQAMFDREEAARSSFSGDPLEFLRKRAKLDLPQGARYVASCSRAASVKTVRGPLAIFTFGRNIDCYNRTWRDWARTTKRGPEEKLKEPPMSQDCYIEGKQTKKFLDDVAETLQKLGFEAHPDGHGIIRELAWADGIFRIELQPYNIYDRAESVHAHPLNVIEDKQAREAALAACSDMPSGPILVVRPGDRFFEKEPLDTLDVALQKAGLNAEEYDAMKIALFLACMDVETDTLQILEAVGGDDPAKRQAIAVRRANANLYRKLAAELAPLLDALKSR